MLNIDTLKYNYYNDIAKFVINLCEGSFIGGLSNFNNYSSKDYYKDSKWMYSIKENDIIFHEDMNSWNSFRNLNKSMRDAAWFQFFEILAFKAEEAGKQVIRVPSKNTSQVCSRCGQEVKKDLSERIHSCPFCGFTTDRDHNAALNIYRLGTSLSNFTHLNNE